MKQFLKQYTAWVTNLSRDIFRNARLRLTAIYVFTMMTLIIIFSVSIFQITARNIRVKPIPKQTLELRAVDGQVVGFRRIEPLTRQQEKEIRKDIIQNMQAGLVIIDLILFVLISFLGYLLAGITLKPIKAAYTSQKRFVQNISHDLKTPLAVMRSELEVEMLNPDHRERESYKSLLEEVKTMSKLVDELFFLSQMDTRRHVSAPTATDIALVLENRAQFYSRQIEQKGIDFSHSVEQGIVFMEKSLVERVLNNILSNALRYTEQGQIHLTGRRKGALYEVIVADTGVGIAPREIPYIFERFYKGDASRTKRDSSGLGLSIVEEIMRLYKGKVTLTSNQGKGTTVTLCFPLAPTATLAAASTTGEKPTHLS